MDKILNTSQMDNKYLQEQHELLTETTTKQLVQHIEVTEAEELAATKAESIDRNRIKSCAFIAQAVEDCVTGMVNPLDVFVAFDHILKKLTEAKKEIGEIAYASAEYHGQKTFTYQGFKITLNDGRTQWDWSNCQGIQDLKKALKEEETRLKKLFDGVDANAPATMIEVNGKQILAASDGDGVLHALPSKKFTKRYLTSSSTH